MMGERKIAYVYEVDKVHVLCVDHLGQVLGAGHAHLALAVGHDDGSVVLVEEHLAPRGPRQN